MNNVSIQEFPISLINAIQRQKNISEILALSKGASDCLYVIVRKENSKEIFNVVCYGKIRIEDFLKEISSKEELSFSDKSNIQKLSLFIKTLFEDYDLESIEIDGKKVSLDDIDEIFKSIS